MKNFIMTFSLAMVLICGTVVLNYLLPQNNTYDPVALLGDDLSEDDGKLYDIVFDANGELIMARQYTWNIASNKCGDLLDEYIAPKHDAIAYNK